MDSPRCDSCGRRKPETRRRSLYGDRLFLCGGPRCRGKDGHRRAVARLQREREAWEKARVAS